MLALAAGRLTEADELMDKAFAFGERAQPEMAMPVYQLRRYTLREFRGGLEEVEQAIQDLVTDYPARPAFHWLLAHLYAQLGRMHEARRVFGGLAVLRERLAQPSPVAQLLDTMSGTHHGPLRIGPMAGLPVDGTQVEVRPHALFPL